MIDIQFQGIGMTSRRTRDRLVSRLRDQGIGNEKVLAALRETPRHIFIDEALSHRAYEDSSLPIGFNQTISQPYIVARMTELLLEEGPREKVLEIGTGSGYQTAILAQLVDQVFTVERIRGLQEKARKRLRQLRLHNILFRHTDGGMGWADKGPFDAIIVTAAPEQVPEELLSQLAIGGVMVTPVGDSEQQVLQRIRRSGEAEYQVETLDPVRFVPLLPGTVR